MGKIIDRVTMPSFKAFEAKAEAKRSQARIDQANLAIKGKFALPGFCDYKAAYAAGLVEGDMWRKTWSDGLGNKYDTTVVLILMKDMYDLAKGQATNELMDDFIDGLEKYKDGLETQKADSTQELDSLQTQRTDLSQQRVADQQSLKKANDELDQLLEQLKADPGNPQIIASIAKTRAEIANTISQIESLTASIIDIGNQILLLQAALEDLDELINETTELLSISEKNRADLKDSLQGLEDVLTRETSSPVETDLRKLAMECDYPLIPEEGAKNEA